MAKFRFLPVASALGAALALSACTSSLENPAPTPSADTTSTQAPATATPTSAAPEETATQQPTQEPTNPPESTILDHAEIPTTDGPAGAEALFVFAMRERAAIFSGASAERLQQVSAPACAGCQSIIALDGAIDAAATNISYPTDLEAQVKQDGERYKIRGFGSAKDAQVAFLDGTQMRQKAMDYDVEMEATYRDGAWQIESIVISGAQASRDELHGN